MTNDSSIFPIVTIITICFNSENEIEKTLKSINLQTYKNYEYIIVDGASRDNTLKLINAYSLHTKLISERDDGIYDAMNKGIKYANGKYIIFLNSGDNFHSSRTLEDCCSYLKLSSSKLIYGKTIVSYNGFTKLTRPNKIHTIWKGMPFSHQSVFILTEFQKMNLYSQEYKICSDFNFLFNSFMDNATFQEINVIISEISSNGLSDTKRIQSLLERWEIVGLKTKNIKIYFYYGYLLARETITAQFKKILPLYVVNYFRKIL